LTIRESIFTVHRNAAGKICLQLRQITLGEPR
jgi:hypothetical protein